MYDLNVEARIIVVKEFENPVVFKRISYDHFNLSFTAPTEDFFLPSATSQKPVKNQSEQKKSPMILLSPMITI